MKKSRTIRVSKNCRVDSIDTDDSWNEKKKKAERKITINKICDIEKLTVYPNRRQEEKLSPGRLKEIIEEEITIFIRDKLDEEEETDRERKGRLFPGYDDMKKLSNGIVEDQLEEKCGDDVPGQRRHDKLGRFSSKEDNVSWSLQNKGCGASKMRPGSNVRRATRLPCGSVGRRELGKDIRCYDGKDMDAAGK